jgi:hypothetical protein
VDATAAPHHLCKRVHSLLSKRAFHVDAGNFEGMNFSDGLAPQMSAVEGNAFAKHLLLREFSLDANGLQRLHRLKEILDFHPTIVNPELSSQDKSYYY